MPEPDLTAPVVAFTADAQTGEAPLTVAFSDTSTGQIAGYAWSFGDGEVSRDKDPVHIFAEPGNYTVSLTVFNEAGSDTATYRIDVNPPDEAAVVDRAETVQDLVPQIRAGLRRPSELKLRYRDIVHVLNDLLRGYSRDLHVSEQDHRTDEKQAVLSHLDGVDYVLTVPGASEIEVMQLKFLPNTEAAQTNNAQVWREATIVPLEYYTQRHIYEPALASLYAGMVLDDGVKVKLNMSRELVENSIWKVRYRVPILRLLTLSSRTGLPADFLPMLKMEARLMCLQYIRDDSKEFFQWRKLNEPLMIAQVGDWRKRWDDFLNSSEQPSTVRKTPFNVYRGGGRRRGYTVERGEVP